MRTVAGHLFKSVLEMTIKGVTDDKPQSTETAASMGTAFLQSEDSTTALLPQLADLLMAALITQYSVRRLINARDMQSTTQTLPTTTRL